MITLSASKTSTILQGSFLPFDNYSGFFLFFCFDGNFVFTYFMEGCVFLISQYGLSVYIINLSNGIFLTTLRFYSVFRLHPFKPTYKSSYRICLSSSYVPVNECTTPVENLSLFFLIIS